MFLYLNYLTGNNRFLSQAKCFVYKSGALNLQYIQADLHTPYKFASICRSTFWALGTQAASYGEWHQPCELPSYHSNNCAGACDKYQHAVPEGHCLQSEDICSLQTLKFSLFEGLGLLISWWPITFHDGLLSGVFCFFYLFIFIFSPFYSVWFTCFFFLSLPQ